MYYLDLDRLAPKPGSAPLGLYPWFRADREDQGIVYYQWFPGLIRIFCTKIILLEIFMQNPPDSACKVFFLMV